MVEGFDVGYICAYAFNSMTHNKYPLRLYTDSRSLYHLAVSLPRTRERRLQIDLQVLRQAYENRDITDIILILGNTSPADSLTKQRRGNKILQNVVSTGRWSLSKHADIAREDPPVRLRQLIQTRKVG